MNGSLRISHSDAYIEAKNEVGANTRRNIYSNELRQISFTHRCTGTVLAAILAFLNDDCDKRVAKLDWINPLTGETITVRALAPAYSQVTVAADGAVYDIQLVFQEV